MKALTLYSLLDELARLERNKERRVARERMKGIIPGSPNGDVGSPSADGGDTAKARRNLGGTSRKCANCGQTGHIKTNKKYCSTCIYFLTPLRELRNIDY